MCPARFLWQRSADKGWCDWNEEFNRDAGTEQIRAWDDSILLRLPQECREMVECYEAARAFTAILRIRGAALDSRRPGPHSKRDGVWLPPDLRSVLACHEVEECHARAWLRGVGERGAAVACVRRERFGACSYEGWVVAAKDAIEATPSVPGQ